MDEERLSPEQERELVNLFEQAALNDFPNPQRIGCPGSEFLRKMATNRRSISVRDPRLRHVARCSPCFKEFTAFRAQAAARRKRTRITLIAAGVIVVAMATAGALKRARMMPFFGNGARTPAGTYVAATLDMKNRSIVRGAEGTPQAPPPANSLRLPRERVSLRITLPFASEPGQYEVQILREIGKPLRTGSGNAHIENGLTVLPVKVDLGNLSPGQYLIGIRRVPWDWTFNPIVIE
jgi:hypothetical protein